jgi:hypothetical protein
MRQVPSVTGPAVDGYEGCTMGRDVLTCLTNVGALAIVLVQADAATLAREAQAADDRRGRNAHVGGLSKGGSHSAVRPREASKYRYV